MNQYFGKVYTINLDRRTDRWDRIQQISIEKSIIFDRISACDGQTLDKTTFTNQKLLPAEVACTISHINTIKTFLESGANKCLILEDDIEIVGNIENTLFYLSNFPDWDMLYLGANHVTPPITMHPGLGMPTKAYSTCGYALSRSGAEWLLPKLQPSNHQIDVQYYLLNRGKYYCCLPNIITQRPDHSDVQGGYVDYTYVFLDKDKI